MAKHNIPPVYDENSEILILGSFPSVFSREKEFYYANPQNRFWMLLSLILKKDIPESKEGKISFLLENKIALWDVISSCEIEGSLDRTIRDVVPNDISIIMEKANIKLIILNGKESEKNFEEYFRSKTDIKAVSLPSTSPLNIRYSLDRLYEYWDKAFKSIYD